MSSQYSRIANKVLVDHRAETLVEEKLMMLRCEIEEVKRLFERARASHCSLGFCTLTLHLLDNLVEDLERFGSTSSTDARPPEHINVLIKQSYKMTSRWLPTRLQNTVQNTGSAMQNVQKAEDGEAAAQCGEAVLNKRQRLEKGRGYLVRDAVCSSREELLEAIESSETGLSVGNSQGEVLAELSKPEALRSFGKSITEWVFVHRSHVCDGNIWETFVKSGFLSGVCCLSSKSYDPTAHIIKAPRTESCELHKQSVYTSHGFGAERKVLNGFVKLRGEGDEGGKIWVEVLLWCLCFVRRDTEGVVLALLQHTECIPRWDAADKALILGCMRWATTDGTDD